jgi:hypothetical protein
MVVNVTKLCHLSQLYQDISKMLIEDASRKKYLDYVTGVPDKSLESLYQGFQKTYPEHLSHSPDISVPPISMMKLSLPITQVCNQKTALDFFTVSYRFLLTETGESSKNIPSRQFFLQNSYF